MSYTRDQLVAQVAEQLDAVGDPRYSNATTLILPVLDAVYRRGWARILNANNVYRVGRRTATTTNGFIALSALTTGAGDTLTRVYRIIAAAKDTIRYTPVALTDDPMVEVRPPSPTYTFYQTGQGITFQPAETGATMTVWVNDMPIAPSALSGGGVTVVWPDGYELILVYEVTARLAGKGAAETNMTNWHQEFADDLWKDLLADVSRFTVDPIIVGAPDSPGDWGG